MNIKAFIAMTILLVILLAIFAACGNHYYLDGTIVHTFDNKYTVEDIHGNLWEFYADEEDFKVGDEVKVTLDSLGTKTKLDDEIVRVSH